MTDRVIPSGTVGFTWDRRPDCVELHWIIRLPPEAADVDVRDVGEQIREWMEESVDRAIRSEMSEEAVH